MGCKHLHVFAPRSPRVPSWIFPLFPFSHSVKKRSQLVKFSSFNIRRLSVSAFPFGRVTPALVGNRFLHRRSLVPRAVLALFWPVRIVRRVPITAATGPLAPQTTPATGGVAVGRPPLLRPVGAVVIFVHHERHRRRRARRRRRRRGTPGPGAAAVPLTLSAPYSLGPPRCQRSRRPVLVLVLAVAAVTANSVHRRTSGRRTAVSVVGVVRPAVVPVRCGPAVTAVFFLGVLFVRIGEYVAHRSSAM